MQLYDVPSIYLTHKNKESRNVANMTKIKKMHFLHSHELKNLKSIFVAKLITNALNHLISTEIVKYSSNAYLLNPDSIKEGIYYDSYQ